MRKNDAFIDLDDVYYVHHGISHRAIAAAAV
jgi:hypothetical protein